MQSMFLAIAFILTIILVKMVSADCSVSECTLEGIFSRNNIYFVIVLLAISSVLVGVSLFFKKIINKNRNEQ